MPSYARTPVAKKMRGADLIDRANALSVQTVLSDHFGLFVPKMDSNSYKTNCPFAFEHSDGGLDKNCRLYGTSHLYCFAMHGVMGPVRLIQIKKDMRAGQAAEWLLRSYDLLRPKPWRERRDELVLARATKHSSVGNTALLVEALHLSLQGEKEYAAKQFTEEFSGALGDQLDRLDAVLADSHVSETIVRQWYDEARTALTAVLQGEHHG